MTESEDDGFVDDDIIEYSPFGSQDSVNFKPESYERSSIENTLSKYNFLFSMILS